MRAVELVPVPVVMYEMSKPNPILKFCDDWTYRSTRWIWMIQPTAQQRFVPTAILDSSSGLSLSAPVW